VIGTWSGRSTNTVPATAWEVRGVHWSTPTFFWSWGFWNVFYYPSLDQWFSFGAGLLVLFANTAWLYCVLKYTKHDVAV
jgi:hypothetical protein